MRRVHSLLLAGVALICQWSMVFAQDVPFLDPRDISDGQFYINQFESQDTLPDYAHPCSGPQAGSPYLFEDVGEVLPWDLTEDPGDAFFAEDLCGLRTQNLSGVWESIFGGRFVITHDPRSGAFEIRRLYIPPELEPRKTWDVRLGDRFASGRFHVDELWLDSYGRFPPDSATRCPEQARTIRHAVALVLQYSPFPESPPNTPQLSITWPRLQIQSDCSVQFLEMNLEQMSKLDLEP